MVESKLILLVHLRGLQQASYLLGTVSLSVLGITNSLLSLLGIQLCVVIRKLLEGNQEVTEMSLELVQVIGVLEQSKNKLLNLCSVLARQYCLVCCSSTKESLLLKVGEGIVQQIRKVVVQEVFVVSSSRGLASFINGPFNLVKLNKVDHAGQKHSLGFEA